MCDPHGFPSIHFSGIDLKYTYVYHAGKARGVSKCILHLQQHAYQVNALYCTQIMSLFGSQITRGPYIVPK